MTQGIDLNGNEDPNGKKFLFTAAAGNVNPNADLCHTFPAVLGVQMDGVVTVGGITAKTAGGAAPARTSSSRSSPPPKRPSWPRSRA